MLSEVVQYVVRFILSMIERIKTFIALYPVTTVFITVGLVLMLSNVSSLFASSYHPVEDLSFNAKPKPYWTEEQCSIHNQNILEYLKTFPDYFDNIKVMENWCLYENLK